MSAPSSSGDRFELRFQLIPEARAIYAFPCDASGNVDLDALSECQRNRYFYARAAMGREFSVFRKQYTPQPEAIGHSPNHLKEAA